MTSNHDGLIPLEAENRTSSTWMPPGKTTGDGVPTLPLRGLLDLAGGLLRGLPAVLWVEATVTTVKPGRAGHTLELTEAGASSGQGGTLRAYLPSIVLARLAGLSGGALDPEHLRGMTTALRLEPNWSPRFHLGARVTGLSRDATVSLARHRLAALRQALRQDGSYDRQRRWSTPRDVTRVAILHPVGAAGYADIAGELARWVAAGLIVVRTHTAPFEGDAAPRALASALRDAVQPLAGDLPDLVLMVRGGGARSGLELLDHETVVRAVALCPVPVVTGLGHAIDNDLLAGEVAWRACDTPSKAVMLLATLIRAPAQDARAHLAALAVLGRRRLTDASVELRARRMAIGSLADRHGLRAQTGLDAAWTDIRIVAGGAAARCDKLAGEARQSLIAIGAAAGARIDAGVRSSRDLHAAAGMAVQRRLDGVDGGSAHWRAIRHGASSHLDLQTAELRHLSGGTLPATRARLDRAADDLAAAEAVIAASSLETVLSRGFAIATAADGRVIRSATEARTAGDLTLLLHEGDVAVVVKP